MNNKPWWNTGRTEARAAELLIALNRVTDGGPAGMALAKASIGVVAELLSVIAGLKTAARPPASYKEVMYQMSGLLSSAGLLQGIDVKIAVDRPGSSRETPMTGQEASVRRVETTTIVITAGPEADPQ